MKSLRATRWTTWCLLVMLLDVSSSPFVSGGDAKTTLSKEESLELDFHRINKRPTFFNEEILDEKLTRADPFVDDFVPLEYTADSPNLFHSSNHHQQQRHKNYRNNRIHKRYRRDVDSNMIEDHPDGDGGGDNTEVELGQVNRTAEVANANHRHREDVDDNSSGITEVEYSSDSNSTDVSSEDILPEYEYEDHHSTTTVTPVTTTEASTTTATATTTTAATAATETTLRPAVEVKVPGTIEAVRPGTLPQGEPVTTTTTMATPAVETTAVDTSTTTATATTKGATGTTPPSSAPSTISSGTGRPMRLTLPRNKKTGNSTKIRRSDNPMLPTSLIANGGSGGINSNNADTVKWIRSQINTLLQNDLSSEDAELLRALNETLAKPNMDKLVELTLAFMKINEKITRLSEMSEDDEQALRRHEENENNNNIEEEDEPLECKNLKRLKILPSDTQEMVRLKYGTAMKCYMDETADPCQDFYKYSCGSWSEYHPIPKDKSGYDTFEILREDLHANLIAMFEEPISEDDGNATAAAKMLYHSCMDTDSIEERRETPLVSLLDEFGGWPVLVGEDWLPDNFSWIDAVTKLRLLNNDILVSIWIGPDGKDSDDFILQFDQSDLLLPSSDYYKLGFHHPIMQTYYHMLVDVATILGAETTAAEREMKDLIDFETELAGIMISPMLRRNFSEIYKKMPLAELQKLVPGFNFSQYLGPILPRKLNDTEDVVIYALPFYQKLTQLIDNTDKRVLSNYILWRFIRHRINNLDQRFEIAQHALYRMLYGREETPPRRKFCVSYVNGNLGNVVGSLFVRRHFDEQSKKDMEALTDEVQTVFRDLVLKSNWLSDVTKKLADVKIQNIVHNIGYPEDIIDEEQLLKEIEGITYKKKTFFENVLNNLKARTVREMSQLDDGVNRTLWTTTPAVVNAYYSRNRNQIMFPAAILQPPFYHKHFPKALNYGGIGIVIGHEITHGFDDKGRQFDYQGNIKQWWDLASFQNFRERKQCIIDQYGQYKVDEVDIHLNGENTQGENIADNGGIKQAFYAYKTWLERNNLGEEDPLPGLETLSSEQLFFLNFAQVWCGHTRPEALRSKLKTAVHAPGPYRVLGTVSNSEEFARAFRCSSGSRMNPVDKCSVW